MSIELVRWRVMRVKTRSQTAHTFHAVGYVEKIDCAWVSEAIRKYDPDSQVITTATGEVIQLDGPSGGYCRTADAEWVTFCRKRKVIDISDVSSRYAYQGKKKRKAVA